ncbi:MAG: tRNA (guanosine(37)-N1)-methyltransferase TrmD [Alphaproteobacteria bacterium]|nr:tRNA (guanosine(37)-N1)-methyltransferase TrmD [Alphaproteobacteria bacterium]
MAEPWTAWVLTLFPEMFPGPLGLALAGKALAEGRWALAAIDIRDFADDKHKTVDDAPFGGGPGMVMRPDVLARAIDAARAQADAAGAGSAPLIYLSPRGRPLDQARVHALAAGSGAILICGRYEGIDQRVLDARPIEEVSLGDFVLSGGEPAAIALLDAVVRLLPGVVGHVESLTDESFADGLLEYPHYTRPRDWQGRLVPDVLVSGHHENIVEWRRAEAERITAARRTDLWQRYQRKTRVER